VLASIWWIFTLIMASSYTANLAASLTLSRMSPSVENVEDLAKQTTIKYGCKETASTFDFFKVLYFLVYFYLNILSIT
jgi:glutamate receptor, ionotropic, invertebrate